MVKDNKQIKQQPKQQNANLQGITVKKEQDFSEWYQQAILKSEMIEYGPVSGCMIIRPYAYAIWELVQEYFNIEIKKNGVKNAYFPLLIPESLFNKEKEHVEGFNPEVAWVTHGGDAKLAEKLAIRPTSETIMYDSYSKWIRSWRDLPLKLNQWANIVRWEFKHPVPFLRTREFLWQEGHNVFATKKEVEEDVLWALELYRKVFEELYAVPVFKGMKSEKEKFAGALYTTSVETIFPNGKGIQGATSHCLGQNFSKSFEISFLDKDGKKNYAWQDSWGISTRSIGVMLAFHGDDKGLILPPRIAPIQVVIVPILFDNTRANVLKECSRIKEHLSKSGVRVELDDSDSSPGWKFNQWEMKGVPVRIELGPKDLTAGHVMVARRDTGKKEAVKFADVGASVLETLESVQSNLFLTAKKKLESFVVKCSTLKDVESAVKIDKTVFVPFCDRISCEETVKEKFGIKSLNAPFDQKEGKDKCVFCNEKANKCFYFGKSY